MKVLNYQCVGMGVIPDYTKTAFPKQNGEENCMISHKVTKEPRNTGCFITISSTLIHYKLTWAKTRSWDLRRAEERSFAEPLHRKREAWTSLKARRWHLVGRNRHLKGAISFNRGTTKTEQSGIFSFFCLFLQITYLLQRQFSQLKIKNHL